MIVQPIKESHL